MIKKITRNLNKEELKILNKLKSKSEKELNKKNKYYYLFVALLLGIVLAYLASIVKLDFLVFLFGTLAVFLFGFVVFTPYELYKDRRQWRGDIKLANEYLNKKLIDVIPIKAKRIAIAKEYEDEGDLLIVEYETGKILYLWDLAYNMKKRFPCIEFDIYDDDFFKLIGKQFYPITEKVKPTIIKGKDKWNYLKKHGVPGHLEVIEADFEKLIQEYNNVA